MYVLIRAAVSHMRGQEKWIEARTIQDCGRLEEGQVIEVLGLGLARVSNVVQIRSHRDLTAVLGNDLEGLGLKLPESIAGHQAVTALCKEVNLDPRVVELGHLILFNLEFLTK